MSVLPKCCNGNDEMLFALNDDADPAKAEALKAWGRAYWQAVHAFNPGGAYVNFLHDDEVAGRLRASYGANWDRLVAVKRTYDPHNLFRVNHNIDPVG